MANRIAAIDGGMSYHLNALSDKAWAGLIDERIYLPKLSQADLKKFDVVIVTCRSNPDLLEPCRDQFLDFLDAGGTVAAFSGTSPERWLPGVVAREIPTNYWWWLEEGADSGLRIGAPKHPVFAALTLREFTWHHHARFEPPAGATSLVNHVSGGSIFYEDRASCGGRLFVTSLDPFYHHGSFFMPTTSRFLAAFLPWIKHN